MLERSVADESLSKKSLQTRLAYAQARIKLLEAVIEGLLRDQDKVVKKWGCELGIEFDAEPKDES